MKHWRRFQRVGAVLAIPVAVCVIFARDFPGAGLLRFLAYAVALTFGVSGALMAVAQKAGFIRLVVDEESKGSLLVRMQSLRDQITRGDSGDPSPAKEGNGAMTKEKFGLTLLAASAASRRLATQFVVNDLPEACRYLVFLNQSYDGNPLEPGETVYPADLPQVGNLDAPLSVAEVVELLWRNGVIPEWIDISPARVRGSITVFSLICCGRFTSNEKLLYYPGSEFSPFGIKSPPLLPQWTEGNERFDLNLTRIHDPS